MIFPLSFLEKVFILSSFQSGQHNISLTIVREQNQVAFPDHGDTRSEEFGSRLNGFPAAQDYLATAFSVLKWLFNR